MGVTLNSLGIFQKNNQFNHCQHSIKTDFSGNKLGKSLF